MIRSPSPDRIIRIFSQRSRRLGGESVIPSIQFPGMAANGFTKGFSRAAPFVALALLLPAPIAALNSWSKKRRGGYSKGLERFPTEMVPAQLCPKCGSELVVRTAKKGNNPGRKF